MELKEKLRETFDQLIHRGHDQEPVSKFLRQKMEYVSPDATLKDASQKMWEADVGALPVIKDGKAVGFLTDRDIVIRSLARGKDPQRTKVAEVMTGDVYTCRKDDSIKEAVHLMDRYKIQRLLVVDEFSRPLGVISLGEIAKNCNASLLSETVKHIKEAQHERKPYAPH
ncbi:MAG: CBS domain-containing protein [Deltaproteobacteria bacterium]|nr:CBS domain-containing protein [Deltaproteobacteria bacterium]